MTATRFLNNMSVAGLFLGSQGCLVNQTPLELDFAAYNNHLVAKDKPLMGTLSKAETIDINMRLT